MTCNPFKNDFFMQKLTKCTKKINFNCHYCAVSKCPGDPRSLRGVGCD